MRAHVAALEWNTAERLQLFTRSEDDSYYQVWMIRDGTLQAMLPDPYEI